MPNGGLFVNNISSSPPEIPQIAPRTAIHGSGCQAENVDKKEKGSRGICAFVWINALTDGFGLGGLLAQRKKAG